MNVSRRESWIPHFAALGPHRAADPIVNEGGEEYAKIGIGRSTGTKLISAGGNVKNPGVYEIDLGLPVEEFLYSDEFCGGIANGKRLKAVVAGGSSVPILPANLFLKSWLPS